MSQAVVYTDKADGNCRKRERVANDATHRERRPSVMSIAVFHFAKRRRAQRAVRGHKFRGEGGRSRADGNGRDESIGDGGKGADCRFKTVETGSSEEVKAGLWWAVGCWAEGSADGDGERCAQCYSLVAVARAACARGGRRGPEVAFSRLDAATGGRLCG